MNDTREPHSNLIEYTVSDLSGAVKRTVEGAFGLVRVRGEVSGYRGPHSSGHAYFSLKDDRARLEAVIWRTSFARLRFPPEEGMEVIATGRLTTYPGSSKYQIVIDTLEPAGAGALMALLEERKRKLAAEGLFDATRKRKLPYMPRVIGVITSPTGAVIRDIIHRITDRFPLHVVVWPVRVQGETAGAEVAAAVNGFNAAEPTGPVARPDLLIIARGGGSLEDLWGFNDEELVRAVAASKIPVIAAVGHETDWTLVDLAADLRAPTPTGAAEMAVPVKAELELGLARLSARLRACVSRSTDRKRQALRATARLLPSIDQLLALPRRRLDEAAARLDRCLVAGIEKKRARFGGIRLSASLLERRLLEARRHVTQRSAQLSRCILSDQRERRRRFAQSARRIRAHTVSMRIANARDRLLPSGARLDRAAGLDIERRRSRLVQADRMLASMSPQAVLQRGFAVVRNEFGVPLMRAADVTAGSRLLLEFSDATTAATAGTDIARPQKRAQAAKKGPDRGGQGSLW